MVAVGGGLDAGALCPISSGAAAGAALSMATRRVGRRRARWHACVSACGQPSTHRLGSHSRRRCGCPAPSWGPAPPIALAPSRRASRRPRRAARRRRRRRRALSAALATLALAAAPQERAAHVAGSRPGSGAIPAGAAPRALAAVAARRPAPGRSAGAGEAPQPRAWGAPGLAASPAAPIQQRAVDRAAGACTGVRPVEHEAAALLPPPAPLLLPALLSQSGCRRWPAIGSVNTTAALSYSRAAAAVAAAAGARGAGRPAPVEAELAAAQAGCGRRAGTARSSLPREEEQRACLHIAIVLEMASAGAAQRAPSGRPAVTIAAAVPELRPRLLLRCSLGAPAPRACPGT